MEDGGGACRARATVPLWAKRLVDPRTTATAVCCTRDACTKRFADEATYRRERDVYARGLPYVPPLLAHDAAIRALGRRFHADTGLHHNDLDYKNVLRDARTGALYLIDFEHAAPAPGRTGRFRAG
jgi:hypothetical protein